MFNRVRQWEPWLTRFLPQDRGSIALDIGAASGLWSFDLAERFDLVIAFEPHPQAYRALLDKVKENEGREGLGQIMCMNYAVGEGVEVRHMNLYEKSDHTSFYKDDIVQAYRSKELEGDLQVQCLNLNAVVRDTRIKPTARFDFIKVDTEGAEVEVLNGANKLLDLFHPSWIIEYHSDDNKSACLKFLAENDYKGEVLPHPHGVGGHGWIHAS